MVTKVCARNSLTLPKMAPSLLEKPNSRNGTALHLAARNGHATVCEKLIGSAKKVLRDTGDIESGVGAVKELMWMQNKEKDTALHLAARYNFHLVVELLTKEDPHHPHPANDVHESPLYLAASRGHFWVVDVILNNCVSLSYDGPQGTTALHGAVISKSSACAGKLLEWDTSLTRKTDVGGQTPLHYSAILGYSEIIRELMLVDRSCAYIQVGEEKNTPLHLAASRGHIGVIKEILFFCPDLWEIDKLRKMGDTHMIVAALVATVTFAAGFTMPGGYQGNEGSHLGSAILRKNAAFIIFVLADTLALVLSLSVISFYFNAATPASLGKLECVNSFAAMFVQGSIMAMLIAFISGTYASLAPSSLAITTCIVGSMLSYVVIACLTIYLTHDFWSIE